MTEQNAEKTGVAVLHGYDPETGKTSTDEFRERAEDAGQTSPYHRAVALRDSVRDDFPNWIWSIGVNERARSLMADEDMRRWLGVEHDLNDRTCSTPECPGDGRYVAPGRGHLPDCLHLRHLSTPERRAMGKTPAPDGGQA